MRTIYRRLVALDDILEITAYIGKGSPAAAARFVSAVEEACELLVDNPGAGTLKAVHNPRATGVRFWVISGFRNYLIFYLMRPGDGIEVVRVLHGARDVDRILDEL